MSKYGKGLVSDIKKEKAEAVKQAELRRKYQVDENIIIKEKKSNLKLIITLLVNGVRLSIQILLIVFATIGCVSLIYPEVRLPLLEVFGQILQELKSYFL